MYINEVKKADIEEELKNFKKPIFYEDFSLPFYRQDDHIFEILLYYIFNEDVKIRGEYSWNHGRQIYDDVRLMNEGPDEGRDCTLHLNGDAVGVIQCKCYGKDLTKPQVAKEIIKFILFYLNNQKDKDLINDIYNFTYYIVSAKSFNKEASTLIKGFNKNICEEENFEEWVKKVINKYASIKLEYEKIEEDLKEVLKAINVKMIAEEDLYLLLSTKYQDIMNLFFKVKEIFIEDISFDKALHRIHEIIKNREVTDVKLKEIILKKSEEILEDFHRLGEKEFVRFISAVKPPFPRLSFKVNSKIKYKENIYNLANIIIHTALIWITFPNTKLKGNIGRALEISDNKYITYLYSENGESYTTIILNLIKYLESNPSYPLREIKDVIVGSKTAKCKKPGARFNFDGILKKFTKTEYGDKQEIVDLKNKYDFNYHCETCLDFEWKNSIDEISSILKNILKGRYCEE